MIKTIPKGSLTYSSGPKQFGQMWEDKCAHGYFLKHNALIADSSGKFSFDCIAWWYEGVVSIIPKHKMHVRYINTDLVYTPISKDKYLRQTYNEVKILKTTREIKRVRYLIKKIQEQL